MSKGKNGFVLKGIRGYLGMESNPRSGRNETQASQAPSVTCGFIVIHGDAIQLQVAVAMVGAGGVDAMFITNHFPELLKKSNELSTTRVPADYAPAPT